MKRVTSSGNAKTGRWALLKTRKVDIFMEVSQVVLLKYSWFIMLCKFQVNSKASQILNLAPCAIYSSSLLFIYFIYGSV